MKTEITLKSLYSYFLSKRQLNLDTMIATIDVQMYFTDYLDSLAEELNCDRDDLEYMFCELEAHEYVMTEPSMEAYVKYLEVY